MSTVICNIRKSRNNLVFKPKTLGGLSNTCTKKILRKWSNLDRKTKWLKYLSPRTNEGRDGLSLVNKLKSADQLDWEDRGLIGEASWLPLLFSNGGSVRISSIVNCMTRTGVFLEKWIWFSRSDISKTTSHEEEQCQLCSNEEQQNRR